MCDVADGVAAHQAVADGRLPYGRLGRDDGPVRFAMGWLERRAALVEPGTLTGYRNDILIRVIPRLRGRLRVAALFILCPPGRTVKSAAFVGSTGSSNMCPSG